ncbi:hypothetical protein NDU88_007127 [Pleurodeles waltl]|uniref:Peptidase A2 domain-containing protein n=1 Tax=Pleurodeles waltl TaxID=8319 RepID=A0AAV7N9B9_PLEWA|nr:hypothetical protein NDU88_007127 [Pleurodeles waltl]
MGVVENALMDLNSDRVLVVGGNHEDEDEIFHKKKQRLSRPTAIFSVCGKKIELMMDSGSMYTIIPKHVFKTLWQDVELMSKDINPGGYQEESIDILGYMEGDIQFGSRCTKGKV